MKKLTVDYIIYLLDSSDSGGENLSPEEILVKYPSLNPDILNKIMEYKIAKLKNNLINILGTKNELEKELKELKIN